MIRRVSILSLTIVAVLGSAAAAERVRVVRSGHEPACLDLAMVASAIARHAKVPADVGDASDEDGFVVRVDAEGRRVAVVVAGRGQNTRRILDDGPCDALPEVIAAYVAGAVMPSADFGDAAPGATPSNATSARAALLADALSDYAPRNERRARLGVAVEMLLGGTYGALTLATADGSFDFRHVLAIGGTAMLLAGGVVELASPGGERGPLIGTASYLLGSSMISVANAFIDTSQTGVHVSGLISAGAFATVGLWYAADRIRHPPTSRRTIWELRRRFATAEARAQVDEVQLAAAEDAFRNSDGPVRRYAIPFAIGSVASFAVAARSSADSERAVTDGVVLGVVALLLVALPTPVDRYAEKLEERGLDVSVGPIEHGTAVVVGGRF